MSNGASAGRPKRSPAALHAGAVLADAPVEIRVRNASRSSSSRCHASLTARPTVWPARKHLAPGHVAIEPGSPACSDKRRGDAVGLAVVPSSAARPHSRRRSSSTRMVVVLRRRSAQEPKTWPGSTARSRPSLRRGGRTLRQAARRDRGVVVAMETSARPDSTPECPKRPHGANGRTPPRARRAHCRHGRPTA